MSTGDNFERKQSKQQREDSWQAIGHIERRGREQGQRQECDYEYGREVVEDKKVGLPRQRHWDGKTVWASFVRNVLVFCVDFVWSHRVYFDHAVKHVLLLLVKGMESSGMNGW